MDAEGRITVPKADKILTHYRDQQIRRERDEASLAQLAHRYGLTVRHIQNIIRDQSTEDRCQMGFLDF
jgi:Mor family transcriptional regulator